MVLICIFIVGCAGAVDAPSLALRPVESAAPTATPQLIPPALSLDSATTARLATIAQRAKDGAATFDKAALAAQLAVDLAAGAQINSDAWIAAQLMLSRLERAREPVAIALTEFDTLERDMRMAGKAYDPAAFSALTNDIVRLNADQQAQANALIAKLKVK